MSEDKFPMQSVTDIYDQYNPEWRQFAYNAPPTAPSLAATATTPPPKAAVQIGEFYSYLPLHRYIYSPDGALWPAESVNGHLPPQVLNGLQVKPSVYLDKSAAVQQMTWDPGKSKIIQDELIAQGGWFNHPGTRVYNLYRPAPHLSGDATKAGLWREHLASIYPDAYQHIEYWLAHRVQQPGVKVNHALVLRGSQGIGKDSILEPVKQAIGHWNWQEVTPSQILGRFNDFVKSVVVRINEGHDLGDFDRFAFYERSKLYLAAPPDVLRVDEKHLREYYVPNVCGAIITTNHEVGGLFIPPDDRRHFVASSEATKEEFSPDYWRDFWAWYAAGGIGHVAEYLRTLDLSGFNAKAPPRKTEAFWRIVQSNAAPEDAALMELIEAAGHPKILTLDQLRGIARTRQAFEIADFLGNLKSRRQVQHRLESAGYVPVRNKDREDGLWPVDGKRKTVYAQRALSYWDAAVAIRGLK